MDFRKRKTRDEPDINLIPFIDVLLVILIFLMVTTTYSKYTELQVTLPTADAESMPERPRELYVIVDASGQYAINNRRIVYENPAQLAREMRIMAPVQEDGKDPVVIIAADGNAPHQRVINVMEAARLAGLERLTFATQSEAGGQERR
ncbi:MAG: biopolymer transporter ExbD [Alistipes senegalensis]|nr:biopolymer transporter ExbD [Oxalobacter formigenes]MCM1280242.1 biopolymer transporter ExbD [Alistipes senegalensis]